MLYLEQSCFWEPQNCLFTRPGRKVDSTSNRRVFEACGSHELILERFKPGTAAVSLAKPSPVAGGVSPCQRYCSSLTSHTCIRYRQCSMCEQETPRRPCHVHLCSDSEIIQSANHRLELILLLSFREDCPIIWDVLPLLELVYLVVEHIARIQRMAERGSCDGHTSSLQKGNVRVICGSKRVLPSVIVIVAVVIVVFACIEGFVVHRLNGLMEHAAVKQTGSAATDKQI